jgi:hypothetical protein
MCISLERSPVEDASSKTLAWGQDFINAYRQVRILMDSNTLFIFRPEEAHGTTPGVGMMSRGMCSTSSSRIANLHRTSHEGVFGTDVDNMEAEDLEAVNPLVVVDEFTIVQAD